MNGTGVHWDGMLLGIRVIEVSTKDEIKFQISCNCTVIV